MARSAKEITFKCNPELVEKFEDACDKLCIEENEVFRNAMRRVIQESKREEARTKKELDEVLAIVDKFKSGENLTLEEIKTLAYTDIHMLDTEEWSSIDDTLSYILEEYGEEWSEYDDRFPNNPYLYGYILEGHTFVTGYTGVAGCYWYEQTGMLCA